MSRLAASMLILNASVALAVLAGSDQHQLRLLAWAAGGGAAAGSTYRQSSLVSQTATGRTASTGFVLHHGFYGGSRRALTGARDPTGDLPRNWRLDAARPNPFNPATRICYDLPASARVRLLIYDLKGRLVRRLLDQERPPGRHELLWDGRDDGGSVAASGTYLLMMRAGAYSAHQKLTLLK